MAWTKNDLTEKLHPIVDARMLSLREQWFESSQPHVEYRDFKPKAIEWFRGTKVNDLQGWDAFPYVDVTMGCTHFIESFALKYGWDGFQVLNNDYAYYTLMGKYGVDCDQLEPNKPLIVTLPNWHDCDIRKDWPDVLKICEQRSIDIHIDMAWVVMARDLGFDFDHPNIKSFGMSMSKFGLQWSRVGLRWSRQKGMDSITIFNDYYIQTNTVMTSVGSFFMDNLSRDYNWDTYGKTNQLLCQEIGVESTKLIHVVKDPSTGKSLGIGKILGKSTPHSI